MPPAFLVEAPVDGGEGREASRQVDRLQSRAAWRAAEGLPGGSWSRWECFFGCQSASAPVESEEDQNARRSLKSRGAEVINLIVGRTLTGQGPERR